MISKVDQKYKGCRRIERRPLISKNVKPKVNPFEKPKVVMKKVFNYGRWYRRGYYPYITYRPAYR
jgi:hypothetical protein